MSERKFIYRATNSLGLDFAIAISMNGPPTNDGRDRIQIDNKPMNAIRLNSEMSIIHNGIILAPGVIIGKRITWSEWKRQRIDVYKHIENWLDDCR